MSAGVCLVYHVMLCHLRAPGVSWLPDGLQCTWQLGAHIYVCDVKLRVVCRYMRGRMREMKVGRLQGRYKWLQPHTQTL